MRPTKRAPDAGDSAEFSSIFLRLAFFWLGGFTVPAPAWRFATTAVGQFLAKDFLISIEKDKKEALLISREFFPKLTKNSNFFRKEIACMETLTQNKKCTSCQSENIIEGTIKGRLYFLPSKMFGGGYNMQSYVCLDCGNLCYYLNDTDLEDLKAFTKKRE